MRMPIKFKTFLKLVCITHVMYLWLIKFNQLWFSVYYSFLVADLFHLYTKTIIDMRKPESGIYTLERAIAKLQEHPAQLTTLHADFCQLCLLSKNFKPAFSVLDNDITSISKEVIVRTKGSWRNLSLADVLLDANAWNKRFVGQFYQVCLKFDLVSYFSQVFMKMIGMEIRWYPPNYVTSYDTSDFSDFIE